MGNNAGKATSAYNKPLIRGLPDALPYFEIKANRPHEWRCLAFSTLDWEYLERPLHSGGQVLDPTPVAELKQYRPLPNPFIFGTTTATFPRRPNPNHGNKTEWMSHPIADAWFIDVTDSCAYGAMFDGSGPGHRGWSASHVALVEVRHTLQDRLRVERLRSSVDAAELVQKALVAAHNVLLEVDEAQATTAAIFIILPLPGGGYGMVYAAIGDVEMYRYCQDKQSWQSLIQPFSVLRFKDPRFKHAGEGGIGKGCGEYNHLKSGMNLQYGAVALDPNDLIMLSTDGLGDVLDPIPARLPPTQLNQQFADWHHFAKQHDMDGPAIMQDIKIGRLSSLMGQLPAELGQADIKGAVDQMVAFAMDATKGERQLYSDPSFRDESGRIITDKVDKARAAGLASGDYSYAKMDHLGLLAFAPKSIAAAPPRPRSSADSTSPSLMSSIRRASMTSLNRASMSSSSNSGQSMGMRRMSVGSQLKQLGEKITSKVNPCKGGDGGGGGNSVSVATRGPMTE